MKKIQIILSFYIVLLWQTSPGVYAGGGETNFSVKPFAPTFVRNKGQFDKYDISFRTGNFQRPVAGCQSGNTIILIKKNSIEFVENIGRKNKDNQDEKEKMKYPESEFEMQHHVLTFLGANPLAEYIEGKSVDEYFTYPDPEVKNGTIISNGFKQVFIKNIYPGIEVDYSIQDEGGIKYSFLVSEGYDPSIIKMEWSGVDNVFTDLPVSRQKRHGKNLFFIFSIQV
jgi:hypothetical protein